MKLAIIAIGLPGSGKTTFLKPLAKKYGLVYINRDDIREEKLGDPKDHSDQKAIWEEANRRTNKALKDGQGVVLDATFLEKWKRQDMITFLRASGAERIMGILFDVPVEIAKERNAVRERVVRDEVMDWMVGKLNTESPTANEGFDALYMIKEFEKLDMGHVFGN